MLCSSLGHWVAWHSMAARCWVALQWMLLSHRAASAGTDMRSVYIILHTVSAWFHHFQRTVWIDKLGDAQDLHVAGSCRDFVDPTHVALWGL